MSAPPVYSPGAKWTNRVSRTMVRLHNLLDICSELGQYLRFGYDPPPSALLGYGVRMDNRQTPLFRLLIGSSILFSCIGCDQATKNIATRTLQHAPLRSYLGDTVRLQYALNPGGFLGLGSHFPERIRSWIFVGFNSCVVFALCGFVLRRNQASLAVFVSLVVMLAGALGNQIDRISNKGLVTDFLNLGVGPLRTGVFNVADMALMFGGLAAPLLLMRDGLPTTTIGLNLSTRKKEG